MGFKSIWLDKNQKLRTTWKLIFFLLCIILVPSAIYFFESYLPINTLINNLQTRVSIQENQFPSLLHLYEGLRDCGIFFAISYFFLRFIEKRKAITLGFSRFSQSLKWLGQGILLGALPVTLFAIYFMASGQAFIRPENLSLRTFLLHWWPATIGFLAIAGYEELIFRGIPLQLLSKGLGQKWAILLVGMFFGLGHLGSNGSNFTSVAFTAINAALLAWLVIATGNLILAIGYHASWNIMGGKILGLLISGREAGTSLLKLSFHNPEQYSWWSYGYEGFLGIGVLECVFLSTLIFCASRLPKAEAAWPFYQGKNQIK